MIHAVSRQFSPTLFFSLKLNLVCQYILQSAEFCTCLHNAGILGKLTGCNHQVVIGIDSWPGNVCTGIYSENQHFTSRRVAGSCCFSILKCSGGLKALSGESAVGGPCAKNQPTASHIQRALCVPSPSHHSLCVWDLFSFTICSGTLWVHRGMAQRLCSTSPPQPRLASHRLCRTAKGSLCVLQLLL